MSVATRFKYHRAFPFCAAEYIYAPALDEAQSDNLTLAQVMALFWNLESWAFNVSLTDSLGTVSGSITLNPEAFTGLCNVPDLVIGGQEGAMYDLVNGGYTTPKERVCYTGTNRYIFGLSGNGGNTAIQLHSYFWLSIGLSSGYPGKYAARLGLKFDYNPTYNPGYNAHSIKVSGKTFSGASPITVTFGDVSWTAYLKAGAMIWNFTTHAYDFVPGTCDCSLTAGFYTYP